MTAPGNKTSSPKSRTNLPFTGASSNQVTTIERYSQRHRAIVEHTKGFDEMRDVSFLVSARFIDPSCQALLSIHTIIVLFKPSDLGHGKSIWGESWL